MRDSSWFASTLKSRSGILQWISLILAVVFLVWIVRTRQEDLQAALSLTPALFALISASAILTFLVNGIELKVLSARFDSNIPFKDALLLGLMVSTLNYLPMKSGTMLNGVILKVRYGLTYAHFAALVAGSSAIHLWVALVIAGGALVVTGRVALGLAMSLGPTAAIGGLMLWGRMRSTGRLVTHDSKIVRTAGRAFDGIGLIFASPRLLLIETLVNLALILLASLRTAWAFDALSAPVGFAVALVVTAVGIAAARLSVIPGGLGFREGGAAAGAAMAGIAPGLGLAAAVIDRAVTLLWLLVLGLPATIYLQRTTGIHLEQARELSAAQADEPAADAVEGA